MRAFVALLCISLSTAIVSDDTKELRANFNATSNILLQKDDPLLLHSIHVVNSMKKELLNSAINAPAQGSSSSRSDHYFLVIGLPIILILGPPLVFAVIFYCGRKHQEKYDEV
mmetsp:Transcript_4099/g.6033  ORF Transcript_4099/g.6033 Transcript_4099/m.6033 type:complete len:113 (+) Transcript_4099:68-406(+)